MTDLEQRLAATFESMAAEAPHDPDLLGTVRAASTRRRPSRRVVTVVAAAVAAAVVVAGVVAVRDRDRDLEPASYPCGLDLAPRALPDWAADQATVPLPYVTGDRDELLAIVAEYPEPLFVSIQTVFVPRTGAGTMQVEGRVRGGDATFSTEATPGQGVFLDVPVAGCWDVDLTWAGHRDHVVIPVQRASNLHAGDGNSCSLSSGGRGAGPDLAWREPVDWAGVVDHVVELTAIGLPDGTPLGPAAAKLSVDVTRVLWSRPGAEPLPADLTLGVIACEVSPREKNQPESNWVPGQRYVAAVLDLPAHDGMPAGWGVLSPGSVFAYDDGVLDVHDDLTLDSAWQRDLRGRPASALVAVLRDAERANADLLAPLADEPDPYVRSEVLRAR